ncbi:hypothetical protein EYF80_059162 [Liparis tanakae]|uniref:Uncharacterized protein n=1 Tax=Liparis tanakae TaxID=230148 RepID=A0A4Z2EP61_9TELE|nr:hypothetical protein EYF80_059162 [Liparis tanakae]
MSHVSLTLLRSEAAAEGGTEADARADKPRSRPGGKRSDRSLARSPALFNPANKRLDTAA